MNEDEQTEAPRQLGTRDQLVVMVLGTVSGFIVSKLVEDRVGTFLWNRRVLAEAGK